VTATGVLSKISEEALASGISAARAHKKKKTAFACPVLATRRPPAVRGCWGNVPIVPACWGLWPRWLKIEAPTLNQPV